jgi:hypothetical protein
MTVDFNLKDVLHRIVVRFVPAYLPSAKWSPCLGSGTIPAPARIQPCIPREGNNINRRVHVRLSRPFGQGSTSSEQGSEVET